METATRAGRGFLRGLVRLLLPPACGGCGQTLPASAVGEGICQECRLRLREPAHPRCPRCHAPRGTGLPEDRPCPECSDWPPVLVRARSVAVMAPPADALVHGLKYGAWTSLAAGMGQRMGRLFRSEGFDEEAWVVPVPTTRRRRRRRGFNQAELLARQVARVSNGEVFGALVRKEGGSTQVALHRAERRENVREAFSPAPGAESRLRGRGVVLVDDVLTTGATACAAAEALGAVGAREVSLLTFARALPGEAAR